MRREPPSDAPAMAREAMKQERYGDGTTIAGVNIVPVTVHSTDDGLFWELGRFDTRAVDLTPKRVAHLQGELSDIPVRQMNGSILEPGRIKAWHLHPRQWDIWWVPPLPNNRLFVALWDIRDDAPTKNATMTFVMGAGNPVLVAIPPMVAHGCMNRMTQPVFLQYLVSMCFTTDPQQCQEYRLPWDYRGADFWEPDHG